MHAIVHSKSFEVDGRLADFGLNLDQVIEIVKACAAAQGGCTDNDPPGARGFESWRWGVRRAREILRPLGWDKDDTGGFSTIVNHDRKFRLAIMNADDGVGTVDRVPQNRSRKGAISEQVSTANRQLAFPGVSEWPIPVNQGDQTDVSGYATWHLCVYKNDVTVRAELSLLSGFENGFYTEFIEKIFILSDGDWDPLSIGVSPGGDEPGQEFDVRVVRK